MSMITSSTWVPRGYAAQFPEKHQLDKDEFDRISKLAQSHLEEAQAELEESKGAPEADGGVKLSGQTFDEIDDDLREYDLENYDDEPVHNTRTNGEDEEAALGVFGNIKSLVYHENNEEDPYITLPEGADEDEDEEEREELQILATDNLILAGRLEDDVAHLEVYVYEDEADNLYVHHDVMLPAIPLAVEWLDIPVQKKDVDAGDRGNFVAVGTMDPDIEIWDLDIVDCLYPNAILGQGGYDSHGAGEGTRKKKKKTKKAHDEYHVDSILALAANRQHRNLLASGSADKTVKLWDLNTTKCAKSYQYHSDKVCTLAWHPQESTAMLSGSYDKTVIAADMRAPDAGIRTWKVDSDLESVRWNPHDLNYFYAATESGMLHYFDARRTPSKGEAMSASVWRLQAHDESVSAFDVNPVIPGFLATGSSDKQVKLWNVQPEGPSMVASRDLDVGRVFAANFAPDKEVGFRLAVAGSKGNLQVWDTSTNAAVRRAFAGRMAAKDGNIEEKLVGLTVEDTDSESEDEVEENEEPSLD